MITLSGPETWIHPELCGIWEDNLSSALGRIPGPEWSMSRLACHGLSTWHTPFPLPWADSLPALLRLTKKSWALLVKGRSSRANLSLDVDKVLPITHKYLGKREKMVSIQFKPVFLIVDFLLKMILKTDQILSNLQLSSYCSNQFVVGTAEITCWGTWNWAQRKGNRLAWH